MLISSQLTLEPPLFENTLKPVNFHAERTLQTHQIHFFPLLQDQTLPVDKMLGASSPEEGVLSLGVEGLIVFLTKDASIVSLFEGELLADFSIVGNGD